MLKHLMKVASIMMILLTSLGSFSASAQNRTISGKVVDAGGQPVIGAAVMVVGNSRIGTATDLNGAFSLSVPAGANISVESIGYKAQSFPIGNQTTFNIVLEEDTEMLEETVVIGYGVQKKSDLSGAVSSVRREDLENRSTTDAAAALQGKAAGVQIINSSGAPGEGASIRVRGYSSNSGSIGPLLIVDGLKVDNIQYLDPSMIESMEVLKDAASAAIYGAQAGNGVVLITTKTGASNNGASRITYNGRFTLQSLGKKADIFNAKDYIEYQSAIGNITQEQLKANGYNGTDTNWYDAVFAPSWSQQHGITFQGGNNKGHFFTALNYVDQDGIVVGKKDVYNRLTAQVNADYQLYKWFSVSTNNSFEKWSRKSVSSGYGSVLNSVVSLDPLTPPYISDIKDTPGGMQEHYLAGDPIPRDPTHNNDFYGTSKYLQESTGNPLFQRDKSDSSSEGINVRGNFTANLTPLSGLVFTSRFGYRIAQDQRHSYSEPYWLTSMAQSSNYSISANVNTSYYYQWENFVNYNKNFGKHAVNAMAGMSYTESHNDNASISSDGTDILRGYAENFRYISYLLSDATKTVSNAPGMSANMSYFGRLVYTYDNRYSVQANFRADAFDSSKLPAYNRWGYFPSFSAGWTVSNERFFKENINTDVFNFLKLRASWGRNGNISVLGGYPYAATINKGTSAWYQFDVVDNGVQYGSAPSGLPNTNLRWEKSEQWDLGLDARLFNNRLTFGVDYFNKQTKDLLFSVSVPPELGVSSTMANGGNILNTGLEFELGWKDQIGDFGYAVNANFSSLHNEVVSLAEGAAPSYRSDASSTNYQIRTAFEPGFPVWYLNGYIYEGMDAEGNPLYRNKAGEVVDQVSTDDMQYIGQGTPKFTYGINVNLNWRGFDLAIFGAGAGGNSILPVLHRTGFKNNLKWYLDNSNTPENPNGKLPHPSKVIGNYIYWSSTANLFKGDYFRIKQLQLGYTLPARITRKVAISNLRFYVSLDDFFTFTKYPGLDPETASTNNTSGAGLDWGSYPTMQKLILGVNLTF